MLCCDLPKYNVRHPYYITSYVPSYDIKLCRKLEWDMCKNWDWIRKFYFYRKVQDIRRWPLHGMQLVAKLHKNKKPHSFSAWYFLLPKAFLCLVTFTWITCRKISGIYFLSKCNKRPLKHFPHLRWPMTSSETTRLQDGRRNLTYASYLVIELFEKNDIPKRYSQVQHMLYIEFIGKVLRWCYTLML